ncbi:MAG: RusA family crossover junction endodeoxyribonuclease [Deltaproteobacteria bacterium]|nr:RusA family crossover junction endodeoxyribonuclease [Deltaproteobacteria bacterium]
MNQHVFTVYGSPVAQGRPRFFRRGNFVGTYDPDKSRTWKQDVKASVLDQLNGTPEIHEGALGVKLFFHLPRPKSLPKRVVHHVKKPDADNLAKAIKDALRGVVYRDDSQIVALEVRKVYGDPPRVIIAIEEVMNV